jgi:glycosyltransferase involved in cell wall biosynthesis
MRIAYLTGQYPRATDTFIQREVAALRASGVHVQTFSVRRPPMNENVGPEQQAERERTRYLLPCSPWTLTASVAKLKLTSPLRYLRALRLAMSVRQPGIKALAYNLFYLAEACVLAEQMRKDNLTHLHNHFGDSSCTVAMLAAELGGFTFSFSLHGPGIFFEPHHWRLDEKLRRALFVCNISHFCRSQAMIFCPPDKWDRLHIVHCGVEPELFEPITHSGQGTRLLTVGRLASVKGVPVLLDAVKTLLKSHPKLTLTVVGDGPERKAFEQRAAGLGIDNHVKFVGYQSQTQVRQRLSETDLFVLPSFAEGVPVVLMEAMAAGVPVVATRIAGIAELVDDNQSGRLVPPGNGEALTHAIDALLNDPGTRNALGQAGRRKVQAEFNIAKESAWLRRVMTSALGGHIEPVRPDEANAQDSEPVTETAGRAAS